MAEPAHVKLSGDIEGDYLVTEQGPGGELHLVPEWPSADTSAEAILERAGGTRMSAEEFERHFGHLPTDDQG